MIDPVGFKSENFAPGNGGLNADNTRDMVRDWFS